MTSIVPIQCLACRRLKKKTSTCEAFPDGIPKEMLAGGDHRSQLPGDHGRQFLQRNDDQGKEAFDDWKQVFDT